jgi:3-deoxy-D-manno-octulosonate 8-phosphate phosphatase (KDO 8-P phosphatase)
VAKEAAAAKDPAAAKVELLILDVDGVLTDGSIFLDDLGHETKRFNVRDGFGIKLWQRMGFQTAIITGRSGRALQHRMAELKVQHTIQGSADKGKALVELAAKVSVPLEKIACLADDWPELPMMKVVGYPMCVADADARVKKAAAFVTKAAGGHGAAREAVEHLLSCKGLMEQALKLYD